MKDLEKIKREYEEKLRLAELANNFERVTSIEPNVFHSGDYDFISVKGYDIATIARVLKEYPADAPIVLNASAIHIGDKHGMYHLSSRRDYNDKASRLEIEYYNNNVKFWLDININGNEVLEQFFTDSYRTIEDTELSTYHPVNHEGKLYHDMRIPCKKFKNRNVETYYKSVEVLLDENEIDNIINAIKNN